MTLFETVALYVAIFLLLNLVLMMRVGSVRLKSRISIGDGGDNDMLARIRAHGNYVETVVFAIIALFTLAQLGAPIWALHLVGAANVIGRIAHAIGMGGKYNAGKGRPAGMMLFMLSMVFTAGYVFYAIIAL